MIIHKYKIKDIIKINFYLVFFFMQPLENVKLYLRLALYLYQAMPVRNISKETCNSGCLWEGVWDPQ